MRRAILLIMLLGISLLAEAAPNTIVEKPGADSVAFERSVATINALLVRPLNGGGHAAQAMRLSATAVKDRTDDRIGFGFNQPVGGDMRTALNEVLSRSPVNASLCDFNAALRSAYSGSSARLSHSCGSRVWSYNSSLPLA